MSLLPFRSLLSGRLGRSYWVFQRTDDAMSAVVVVVGVSAQFLLPLLFGFAPWVAIGVLLLLPFCLVSGRLLRFRDGSVWAWRVFVGVPVPGSVVLSGGFRLELGDREIDFATLIPELALVDDHGGAIELAVQPGQETALQRALEEGMESTRAPTCF